MKLKSLLIIFLILGFFVAVSAVRPAAAFEAEVSIISDFDAETKTMAKAKDAIEGPLKGDPDYKTYFDAKPVLSIRQNMIKIDVTGYGRAMQWGDVYLTYYQGAQVVGDDITPKTKVTEGAADNITITSTGCEVELDLDNANMNLVNWVRVRITDKDRTNPIYFWIPYVHSEQSNPAGPPIEDPLVLIGDTGLTPAILQTFDAENDYISFSNSIYLTYSAARPLYWWLLEDPEGEAFVQSDKLADSGVLSYDLEDIAAHDDPLVIRFTDARGEGPDGYGDSNFAQKIFENAEYRADLPGGLNPVTNYDAATGEYSILVPVFGDIEASDDLAAMLNAGTGVEVRVNGEDINATAVTSSALPAYADEDSPEAEVDWVKVVLGAAPAELGGDDPVAAWTYSNMKVVIAFEDTSADPDVMRIATAKDGVGPKLLSSYVRSEAPQKLTLVFSEKIKNASMTVANLINSGNIAFDPAINVFAVAVNSQNPKEIILTSTASSLEKLETVSVQAVDDVMNITDIAGNPAMDIADIPVTTERTIERVAVTGVDLATTHTFIEIEFNDSMNQGAGSDAENIDFYRVEYVQGLTEDADNEGFADLSDASAELLDDVTVRLTIPGVIAFTGEDDLPEVTIVDIEDTDDTITEMKGADGAPLKDADKVPQKPEDEVRPYLSYASFNYNPKNKMDRSVEELITEDGDATLSVFFSEKINSALIGPSVFESVGGLWNAKSLTGSVVSSGMEDPNGHWRIDLKINKNRDTVTGDGAYKNLPFADGVDNYSLKFASVPGDFPRIQVGRDSLALLQDVALNVVVEHAFEDDYDVAIKDASPLWVLEAETADTNKEPDPDTEEITAGVADEIKITFSRTIDQSQTKFAPAKKVILIDGKADIVKSVSKSGDTLTVKLIETDREPDTAYTPVITFDLNDLTITSGDLVITEDFTVDAKDRINPTAEATANAYRSGGTAEAPHYKVVVVFSEDMDPDAWEVALDVDSYVSDGTGDVDVDPLTFITSISDPVATSAIGCSGKRVAIYVELTGALPLGDNASITLSANFTDLAGNAFAVGDPIMLKSTDLPSDWELPGGEVIPSSNVMRLFGEVKDEDGELIDVSANLYAFSRDKLFVYEDYDEEEDPTADTICFNIQEINAYGKCSIEDGYYNLMIFGKGTVGGDTSPGFDTEEPIILVVGFVNDDSSIKSWEIATTACTANTAFSKIFQGGLDKRPVRHNIDLSKREVIKLRTGWNFISTSISCSYVDNVLCAGEDIDTAQFSQYMYGPNDLLESSVGSLPSVEQTYALENISNLLFTISNSRLPGVYFYDPSFLVLDQLGDDLNWTPAFGVGRGYFIYIKPVKAHSAIEITAEEADVDHPKFDGHDWKIVLFGDKVPGPEYKLKVQDKPDYLIGHWGNLAYATLDGAEDLNTIRLAELLPSTHEVYDEDEEIINAEDITDIIARSNEDVAAVNVCDVNGDPVEIDVFSAFWNYPSLNAPATWYRILDEPGYVDYSDLTFIAPGAGYLLKPVEGGMGTGPYFVSYAPKAESQD